MESSLSLPRHFCIHRVLKKHVAFEISIFALQCCYLWCLACFHGHFHNGYLHILFKKTSNSEPNLNPTAISGCLALQEQEAQAKPKKTGNTISNQKSYYKPEMRVFWKILNWKRPGNLGAGPAAESRALWSQRTWPCCSLHCLYGCPLLLPQWLPLPQGLGWI